MKMPKAAATTANSPPAASTCSPRAAAPDWVLDVALALAVPLSVPVAPAAPLDGAAVELSTLLLVLVLLATMTVVVP